MRVQLGERVRQDWETRCKAAGPGGPHEGRVDGLTVRVVNITEKAVEVKPQFRAQFDRCPSHFKFKQKVILLFQAIEGVDVLLFIVFVQVPPPSLPPAMRHYVCRPCCRVALSCARFGRQSMYVQHLHTPQMLGRRTFHLMRWRRLPAVALCSRVCVATGVRRRVRRAQPQHVLPLVPRQRQVLPAGAQERDGRRRAAHARLPRDPALVHGAREAAGHERDVHLVVPAPRGALPFY